MNDPNVILLSLDADAAVTRVSSSVEVSTDSVLQQAQKFVRATLGTEVGGLVFFVLNEPIEINEESIMAKQFGHFSYKWIRWTKGTLREVLKTNPNIELVQVVAIRAQEFNELPPREFLPELPGGRYFQERPPKAPSSGAEPKEFAQSQENEKTRIHIDRPRKLNNTSVPIALLVPSFGNFQTNIKNIAPSDRAMLYATKIRHELCDIFHKEIDRERKFCSILSEFLGEDISNVTIGDFKTDGGVIHKYTAVNMNGAPRLFIKVKLEQTGTSDPCFQVSLDYLENTRRVRQNVVSRNEKAAAWFRARLPSILITHAGPNIQILGGVMTDRPQIEVLSASVPMYFHVSNQDLFLDLARILTALNILLADLGKLYDNPPPLNPLFPVQHEYPYPRRFKYGNQVITFTYLKRVDPIRLVFEVETEEEKLLYIKYTQRYGVEAHRKAYEFGIAPELLAYDDTLPGGWNMVVMRPIPRGYVETDGIRGGEEQGRVQAVVIAKMRPYFGEGFVHGDLRAANIFVDGERQNIMVIDYDWAGRNKEVAYPPDVRSSIDIWRPRAELSLRPIETQHDCQMLKHLYY
ncbi:hypothetical protein C8R41DRAFT_875283 [Lentinula lateritia]|uniref:Non-specific serine/threonine protein kinase n=1 Tax=Lentinula lateritia TaxID=40482 RepID=A0ABQ8VVT0_9AGAR|nr:hypothetical protein C8R41DRAFT_875283 [Lentinula lateritia]